MRLLCLSILFVLFTSCSPQKPAGAGIAAPSPPEDPLTAILRNKDALKDVSFAAVVEASTGKRILAFDRNTPEDRSILDAVDAAMREVMQRLNAEDSPVLGLRRINEASRHLEDLLLAALDARPGFSCGLPPNTEGNLQRSGYPDLRLVHNASGRVTYVDPKLFEETSIESSLRTFYFEPASRTGKILEDARHLLIGVAHDGNDGDWQFVRWHGVDLSELRLRLKAEFQAANRDLYRPQLIISGGER